MASIVLLKNPLTPHLREIHPLEAGTPVIDWLQAEHPRGFGMPIKFYVNGEEKELDDLDYAMGEDDVAVIALMPADPVTLTTIGIGLLLSAVLSVASYFVMQAFAPKEQSGKKGDDISIYDVSSDQNAAKIGEPIPVVYGEVITAPDYVSQPSTWYAWSQTSYDQWYNGVQYLNMLLCVGQGNVEVTSVYLGDSGANVPDAGVVSWRAFKPAEHRSSPGVISAAMNANFSENVITSPEVGNQEFLNPNDSAGYFAACKPGQKGWAIDVDIVWPSGLFDVDGGSNAGDLVGRDSTFVVYYQELDNNETRIGPEYSTTIWASTSSGKSVTGPWISAVSTSSTSARNRTAIASPLRRTYRINMPKSARWAVKLVRQSAAPNARGGTDRFIWAGLRLYADFPSNKVYGDVTLLAVIVKASQGLGTEAAVRVRCKAVRRLSPPSGGAENPTALAADAFADIYANSTYGANRPRTELDLPTLNTLRTKWSAYQFNHVFRERTTVWEALRTTTIPFAAEPLPLGSTMSIAADGVKAVRSALFTDANIVENSLAVTYSFDDEGAWQGIEIEYTDPTDWRAIYVQRPANALQVERFSLPGCSNHTHAAQFAQLMWSRKQLQRKRITFDTELEGLILQMGDRIGIAHNVMKWGDSGQIIGAVGTTLTADHDLDWSGGTKYLVLRKRDGSVTDPVIVTRGSADHTIQMSSLPITPDVDNDYDYTSFAFGTSTSIVRDFTVEAIRHTGKNTVTIEGVNYNAAVFTDAMPFLRS